MLYKTYIYTQHCTQYQIQTTIRQRLDILQQQHKQKLRAIIILILSGIHVYIESNLKSRPIILCMIAAEVFHKLSLLSFKPTSY